MPNRLSELIAKMTKNDLPAIRQAEIPYEAPLSPSRHRERQFRHNWPARGMAFAIKVPLQDPSGPVVPIPLKKIYEYQYWGHTDGLSVVLWFPYSFVCLFVCLLACLLFVSFCLSVCLFVCLFFSVLSVLSLHFLLYPHYIYY